MPSSIRGMFWGGCGDESPGAAHAATSRGVTWFSFLPGVLCQRGQLVNSNTTWHMEGQPWNLASWNGSRPHEQGNTGGRKTLVGALVMTEANFSVFQETLLDTGMRYAYAHPMRSMSFFLCIWTFVNVAGLSSESKACFFLHNHPGCRWLEKSRYSFHHGLCGENVRKPSLKP